MTTTTTVSPEARAYGAAVARKLLTNRKGHGNGPCSYRVMREAQLSALASLAFEAGRNSK